MRNIILCLLVFALSHTALHSQYVNIPDPNLMEALLEHGVDTNGDFFISFEEAEAVDSLKLLNGITDMTGIEAFVNLRHLDCKGAGWARPNNIVHLDVSANVSLEYLDCGYNLLDTLIVGNNDMLLEMDCMANQLTRLDLSGCPNLRYLNCGGSPLVWLDLSTCTAMETLYITEVPTSLIVCPWTLPFPPSGPTIIIEENESVLFVDCIPPVVSLSGDYVYLPGLIEFSSNEDGIVYLVNSDTLDTMDEIRSACLDSLEVSSDVTENFDLSGISASFLWILAADTSYNISAAEGFPVYGVGIEKSPEFSVEVYPNPASEQVTISSAMNLINSVEIADINGRIIFSNEHPGNSYNIDLSEFRKGLYFLRISDGREVTTRKLIKL